MVDKKKAARQPDPATPAVNQSGQRARFRAPQDESRESQLRRRFASDVITGFEHAEPHRRPSRPVTGAQTKPPPRPRSTKEYDLAVREEIQASPRRDSRSEDSAVRPRPVEKAFLDREEERAVEEGGVPTPRPKLPYGAIPRRKMGEAELRRLPLDHRAGFVLAHIDGQTSMRTLLDLCGMSHEEIAKVVERLLELRVIDLA